MITTDIGLITLVDHKWMNVLAGATVVMACEDRLDGGAISGAAAATDESLRTRAGGPAHHLVEVRVRSAICDEKTGTLPISTDVKNVGRAPIVVKRYVMAHGGVPSIATAGSQRCAPRPVGQMGQRARGTHTVDFQCPYVKTAR
jgi:hypothetical protein